MVFIWRGAGIAVPIITFICGWIVSYSFDDTRLGNLDFTGWIFIWSGIINTVLGILLLLAGAGQAAEEREEGQRKAKHDFFWLPVWIWGIAFIGLGIYFVNTYEPQPKSGKEDVVYEEEVFTGERTIHFYNSLSDTTQVKVSDHDGKLILDETIPPTYSKYLEFEAGKYTVIYGNEEEAFKFQGTTNEDSSSYKHGWYILGHNAKLVLLDVTAACRSDINKTELAEIDWTSKIQKEYPAKSYIEMAVSLPNDNKLTVYSPYIQLPLKIGEKEKVYSLVVFGKDEAVTEEALDEKVIDLCY